MIKNKYTLYNKKLLAFNLLIFLCFFSLSAQQSESGELHKKVTQIRSSSIDTTQVRKLSHLGYDIIEKDSALSKKLLDEALEKSIALKNNYAISNSYRMLGLWHSFFNQMDKTEYNYKKSLEIAKTENYLYLMSGSYFNIGNVKYWKGQYDSCVVYYLKTQAIFDNPEIFKDKNLTKRILDKKKSDLYYNMSAVFSTLKNLPKADEYIDKALNISNFYKNKTITAFYTQQKADNYYENGQTEKALRIRLLYLPELEKSEVPESHIQGYYNNIAQEYFDLNKIDSSYIFAKKSLMTSMRIKSTEGIANSNLLLAKIAIKENKLSEAAKYIDACKSYYSNVDDPTEKRNFYNVLHQYYSKTGNYKEAYKFLELYSVVNDTILKSEQSQLFSELEAKYQSEKKEKQILQQKEKLGKRRVLITVLLLTIIGLLITGLLYFRYHRLKQINQNQKIKQLETDKQLLATASVIKGEEQERSRLAKDLHDGLGGMLSGIKYSLHNMKGNLIMTPDNATAFERSLDMLDSSIKEMRRVAHNMMPEALVKFGLDTALNDFCSDMNQSSGMKVIYQSYGLDNQPLEQSKSITVYRIVQELINNALKHSGATETLVQLSIADNKLSITVEDNGKGFETDLLQSAKGIGWSNIQNRVDFLKGNIDIHSKKDEGTSVLIEIKLVN